MGRERARKKQSGRRNVVQLRTGLAGLDRLAAHLNAFEADPLRDGALAHMTPERRLQHQLSLDGTVRPLGESLVHLFRTVVPDLLRHVRRCEACHRWMVGIYANKRRCGPACHSLVWTREYRRKNRRNVPTNVPADTRNRPTSSQRQPTRKKKTPR